MRLVLLALLLSASLPAEWVEVTRFGGNSMTETDDFKVGPKWRLRYATKQDAQAGVFSVYVHNADGTLKSVAINETVDTGDEEKFTIQRGAGEFYLKVNTFGMRWVIAVEEER